MWGENDLELSQIINNNFVILKWLSNFKLYIYGWNTHFKDFWRSWKCPDIVLSSWGLKTENQRFIYHYCLMFRLGKLENKKTLSFSIYSSNRDTQCKSFYFLNELLKLGIVFLNEQNFWEWTNFFLKKGIVQKKTNDGWTKWIVQKDEKDCFF